ncbi:MAG: cupredoxin domain-containing protein [Actinomycetota bacterium]|nr:cupredoxin domain-containing protein [Actinomycetota bacterium]
MSQRPVRFALAGLAALAVGACGSSSSGYGTSADAAQAKRTVEVTITQAKQYQPASITVAPGEVITFKVTNASTELHEFMLGDAKVQDKHDKDMAAMGMGSMKVADQPNLVDLDPGQTKQLTWKFPDKKGATVIYGSHSPGEYAAGMKGMVTVSG